MILVDTGPLVALFDPKDRQHDRCVTALKTIRWPIATTTPVLTEAFHSDHPMDLADASLVTAAEALDTRRVFTIDRNDFETYRVRHGHRHRAIQIVS